MSVPTYSQTEKRWSRELLLSWAVKALTQERHDSAIVRPGEFEATLDFAVGHLRTIGLNEPWLEEVSAESEAWSQLFRSSIGVKRPEDLRVLYLCGPEPMNDFAVLRQLGVLPQNIWAVESNESLYRQATEQLRTHVTYIRIHHGPLEQFFELVNERFDLIYYDACGPLPSGKPNTLRPLLTMLHRERLAPLGALIMNFAEPPKESAEGYAQLLSRFFMARYRSFPKVLWAQGFDPEETQYGCSKLSVAVSKELGAIYSDFTTRLVVDLAREVLPHCRVIENTDVTKVYFSCGGDVREARERAKNNPELEGADIAAFVNQAGDTILSPSTYPILTFIRCTAPGSLDTTLAYAATLTLCAALASAGL